MSERKLEIRKLVGESVVIEVDPPMTAIHAIAGKLFVVGRNEEEAVVEAWNKLMDIKLEAEEVMGLLLPHIGRVKGEKQNGE